MKTVLFFLILIQAAAGQVTPCGKEGTLEERIKQCNSTKENFVLVSRADNGIEIYKDQKSGLIWSDRMKMEFNHYGSAKACNLDSQELSLFKDLKWKLPSLQDFERSSANGMKTSLPNMGYWFWTSTPVKVKHRGRRRRGVMAQSFVWDGENQKYEVADLKDAASVRCVAR